MSTFGRHVVLFGGAAQGEVSGDTWALKGNGWRQLHDAVHPSDRQRAAMAWDPVRRRAVLFGGSDLTGGGEIDDTWTLRP